ncbi:MAG: diadenylate cyclase, partial [Syntrophales bacterium]|nr:diadenylate cyclase [Syntrophales bacterium]
MIELSSFLHAIRVQDVLDILIIWIMASILLIWFKDRASRFVFMGIGLLGAIYLTARFFELYLTTVVLQGFFTILLFVLVVIFQEDLRRFFERLAMWGRFPQKFFADTPDHQESEIIATTVANLARQRIGALIVLKGKDPLDRHLHGRKKLDGLVSQPLIESIFDPHSSGHDGAVVIEGRRVVQFGCHLPLSLNTGNYGSLGLRHTAALGLSERSDALCIVVSEERGTITVAAAEQLKGISDISALRQEIESFSERMTPKKKIRPVRQWLRENPREKVIALALACVLWITFGYQKESVRRDFTIPVEYVNISPEWGISEPQTTQAQIMLMGPPQAFQLFNPESMKLSLDLSRIHEGMQDITLTANMVKIPSNLSVVGITPSRVIITASRMVSVLLPVHVATEGHLPAGLSVQKITVSPASVRALIPGILREEEIRIRTNHIRLAGSTSSLTEEGGVV